MENYAIALKRLIIYVTIFRNKELKPQHEDSTFKKYQVVKKSKNVLFYFRLLEWMIQLGTFNNI